MAAIHTEEIKSLICCAFSLFSSEDAASCEMVFYSSYAMNGLRSDTGDFFIGVVKQFVKHLFTLLPRVR